MSELEKPFSQINFLVVDDDPIGLDMMVTLLQHYGANTFTADNGLTGLAFARQLKPDVIISDLSMPVMNGWKMIAELKQDHTTLNIPVIALTAHAMRGDREKAIAAGCHNYLTKPIDPYNFVEQLQGMLDEIPELKSTETETSDISELAEVENTTEQAKADIAVSERVIPSAELSKSEANTSTSGSVQKADHDSNQVIKDDNSAGQVKTQASRSLLETSRAESSINESNTSTSDSVQKADHDSNHEN